MKIIYFVRHGLSESNVAGTISGSEDDTDLNDEGRKQARRAGKDLIDKKVELIVSSPMKRTIETAQIIAGEIGYDPTKIVIEKLFVERSYGAYSKRPNEEFWNDFHADRIHSSVETTVEMHKRFSKGLDWLRQREESTIVLVSHGGASRAIRVINEALHHSKMYELDAFANGGIYKFNLE